MRSLTGWLTAVAAAALLGACSSEGAVPEGYQQVDHPEASVVAPSDWTSGDAGDLAEADPDIVDLREPEAGTDLPVGLRLWHYGRTEQETFSSAEGPAGLQAALLPADREQLRREEIDVAGADDGFLLQLQAQSEAFDDPLRFTYVVGQRADRQAIMVSIVGTAELVPDDVVETIVDSFRVTAPVDEATSSEAGENAP